MWDSNLEGKERGGGLPEGLPLNFRFFRISVLIRLALPCGKEPSSSSTVKSKGLQGEPVRFDSSCAIFPD
jgi:hypothetical protein